MPGPSEKWRRARRDRFLRRRTRRLRIRPAPVVWVAGNADGVTAGPHRGREIVEAHAACATVLGVVEAFEVDVTKLLGLEDWQTVQAPLSDPAKAGTALAVRTGRCEIEHSWHRRTIRPSIRRHGRTIRFRMRSRWAIGAWLVFDADTSLEWRVKVKVGHNAPPRFRPLQSRWLARFRFGRADVHLGDGNLSEDELQRALGRKVHTRNVMFVATRWWFPTMPGPAVRVPGADHAGARLVTWPI